MGEFRLASSVLPADWTPLDLPALAALYDSTVTSSITQVAGATSQWDDLSGHGLHLGQATGAKQPTSGSSSQNGRNTLLFDGGDILTAASAADWKFLHAAPCTVFWVSKSTVTGGQTLFATTAASGQQGIAGTSFSNGSVALLGCTVQNFGGVVAQVSSAGEAAWDRKWIVTVATLDLTNATPANRETLYAENSTLATSYGGNTASATVSALNPPRPLDMGGDFNPGFTGELAAWGACVGVLSAGDVSTLISYFRSKLAI